MSWGYSLSADLVDFMKTLDEYIDTCNYIMSRKPVYGTASIYQRMPMSAIHLAVSNSVTKAKLNNLWMEQLAIRIKAGTAAENRAKMFDERFQTAVCKTLGNSTIIHKYAAGKPRTFKQQCTQMRGTAPQTMYKVFCYQRMLEMQQYAKQNAFLFGYAECLNIIAAYMTQYLGEAEVV